MKKSIFILAAILLFAVSASSAEARISSFKIKSYTAPKIKTYVPKITVPKITTPKTYKSGGSLYLQKGYIKKNGTYVAPYLKTKADNSIYNNRKSILGY